MQRPRSQGMDAGTWMPALCGSDVSTTARKIFELIVNVVTFDFVSLEGIQ